MRQPFRIEIDRALAFIKSIQSIEADIARVLIPSFVRNKWNYTPTALFYKRLRWRSCDSDATVNLKKTGVTVCGGIWLPTFVIEYADPDFIHKMQCIAATKKYMDFQRLVLTDLVNDG